MNKLRNMQTKFWLRLGVMSLAIFGVAVLCVGLFHTGIFSGVVVAQAQMAPMTKPTTTPPRI